MLYARDAVYFGQVYRDAYEHDVASETKGWETHRGIPIDHDTIRILSFAGLAALSGIIGNASYAVVKTVIKRLRQHPITKRNYRRPSRARFLRAINEENLPHFLSCVKAYTRGYRDVHPKVRARLHQEKLAHVLAPLVTGRTPHKTLVVSRRKLTKEDMKMLWRFVRKHRSQLLK